MECECELAGVDFFWNLFCKALTFVLELKMSNAVDLNSESSACAIEFDLLLFLIFDYRFS